MPGGSVIKTPPVSAGDMGSIPGLGRYSGEGNGNPLRYSCLRNPMDRGTWQATVHWVARVRHVLVTQKQQQFLRKNADSCFLCFEKVKEGWLLRDNCVEGANTPTPGTFWTERALLTEGLIHPKITLKKIVDRGKDFKILETEKERISKSSLS